MDGVDYNRMMIKPRSPCFAHKKVLGIKFLPGSRLPDNAGKEDGHNFQLQENSLMIKPWSTIRRNREKRKEGGCLIMEYPTSWRLGTLFAPGASKKIEL